MSTTPKSANENKTEQTETANKENVKNNTIPAQVSGNVVEVVESNDDQTLKEKLTIRAKSLVRNKTVIASVTSVAVIAAGVLVARRRNAEDDLEVVENTEA